MECEAGRLVRSMGSTSPRLVRKTTATAPKKAKLSVKSEGFSYHGVPALGEDYGRGGTW